jgi:hypothetical protein
MTTGDVAPVAVSRRIQAAAEDLFAVLADPSRHPGLDGSGMLRYALTAVRCLDERRPAWRLREVWSDGRASSALPHRSAHIPFLGTAIVCSVPAMARTHPSSRVVGSEQADDHWRATN